MAGRLKERTVGWSATDFDPNNAYDILLAAAEHEWGMTEGEVEDFISQIEWHESKGDHTAKQKLDDGSIGRGRGLFQYEVGKGQGAHTAINRLIKQIGYEPSFLEGLSESDYDVSTLSPEQQQILFIADKLRMGDSMKGVDTPDELREFWIEDHFMYFFSSFILFTIS